MYIRKLSMNMRWLFLLIIFLPCCLFAQSDLEISIDETKGCNCGDINKGNNLEVALEYIDSENINDTLTACYYHCVGNFFYGEEDYVKAIKFHEKALKIREQSQKAFVWKSYYMLSLAYHELEMFQKSQFFMMTAHNTLGKKRARDSISIFRIMGINLVKIGEFQQAEEYALKATQIQEEDTRIAHAYNMLAVVLGTKEEDSLSFEHAIKSADTALELYEKTDAKAFYIAKALNNKAIPLSKLGKYDEAIKTYKSALSKHEKESEEYAEVINNIGYDLKNKGAYAESIKTLEKSLKLKQIYYENAPFQYTYASNYENLGEIYAEMEEYDEALHHFQLAIDNLKDDPKSETPHIYNKPDLLRLLDLKAQAALKSGNTDLAYSAYQELDAWTSEFYKDLTTNESKLIWIACAHDIYSHAIEVALKKGEQAKAFEYAEKARAVLLWQSHSQQAALSLLDETEREKYDNLLAQIQQADNEYRNATDDNKTALKDSIDTRKQAFYQFEKTLNDTNSEYAQRKYQPKTTTLNDVQTNILNNNTALIEYHWSADDLLYIFTLTKNEIYIETITINEQFDQWTTQFVEALQNNSSTAADLTISGYKIYQTIFASAISRLNDNIKKIILIPDGKLNYIPFEALPTAATNDLLNTPYLIDDYTFNYLYSCANYQKYGNRNALQTALIIAPEFGKKDTYAPLESKAIVTQLQQQYPSSSALIGTQPTHESVLRQLADADMIHIAAHAEQGTKGKGKIHLYAGDELSQNDIQASALKARHVVLSACETGTGELSQGEGVLSLGWSFVYRGVPSVVMSLWKVNDKSTSNLMKSYYDFLQQKIPADDALHQAKIQLKSSADAYRHPYHWAAFIHTGNPPTKQRGTSKYLYILGVLLGLFFIVYLVRRR